MKKLTAKQKKFVDLFDGNATDAARQAGYNGTNETLGVVGFENLRKPNVAEALRKRNEKEMKPKIANRLERQMFWTEVMQGKKEAMISRLKASELLGRSEADFTDKQEATVAATVTHTTEDEVKALRAKIKNDC